MKSCFKCNEIKPYTEFYKHPKTKDGSLGKCKSCTKQDVKQNRQNRFEYYQVYEKQRSQTIERRKLSRRIHQQWKSKYPERRKAHESLNNAVRDGKIIPQVCWVCGNKGEAHHPDYSKPLDVVWLCSKHHKEVHQMV